MKNIFELNQMADEGICLECQWHGSLCDVTLTNVSKEKKKIGDITVFSAKMPFAPDTEFFGEGYTILSRYCGTVGGEFKLIGDYDDYDFYKSYRPEGLKQVYNMAMFYPKGELPVIVGFASCNRFNGWIRFNEEVLQIALNCENIFVAPNETISLEQIYVEQGEKDRIRENLADELLKNHPRREFSEIPTGWCSWLVYASRVTAQNVYDNLDAIIKHDLDLKYIQI
ncbi:MAG: hypothetical protein IKJ00_02305, partial [Clostridia bacterium]|nr:hypothetical protein [Clostridia bacterium]